MRGAKYGIPGLDLLDAIPESAREPEVAYEFMQMKDISHKVPLSHGGESAGDNWVLEDSSTNRSRGAQTMSDQEVAAAEADAHSDAKQLGRAAKIGAALAVGGAVAEPVVTTGLMAAGALLEATIITPILITGACVAGTAVAGVAVHKHAKKRGWYEKLNEVIN